MRIKFLFFVYIEYISVDQLLFNSLNVIKFIFAWKQYYFYIEKLDCRILPSSSYENRLDPRIFMGDIPWSECMHDAYSI